MEKQQKTPIRLAMRVEGDWWVGYLAKVGTMDGAQRLGAILMRIVENKEHKEAFMALMRSAISDAMERVFGQTADWGDPETAPESERSGRALNRRDFSK